MGVVGYTNTIVLIQNWCEDFIQRGIAFFLLHFLDLQFNIEVKPKQFMGSSLNCALANGSVSNYLVLRFSVGIPCLSQVVIGLSKIVQKSTDLN